MTNNSFKAAILQFCPYYYFTFETTWGEKIDKDKGHKITFMCKQGAPVAIYEGTIALDPNPPTGYLSGCS